MTQARSATTTNDTRRWGTLRLLGPAAVHQADPAAAWLPAERQLLRLCTRQLISYRAEPDPDDWRALAPVADLAVDVPSTYNAGLGASHRSYVVHLRPGVLWDTPTPRPVTAHDVVRGFKRLANPLTRHPALAYFRGTLRGMGRYCDDYAAAVAGRPVTAALLAGFQDAHDIPGVFAVDDETVVFELDRPALDFVDMLAQSCASPAPAEYDAHLPGSPELHGHLIANGPYRIASWQPGGTIRLEPNPAWRAETDPIRQQRFDAVEFRVATGGPRELADRLAADDADLPWGVPTGPVPGHRLDPCLVFNLRDPANPAVTDVTVRRVVAGAIDRAALVRIGRAADPWSEVRAAHTVVPPGNDGHRSPDPAPDADADPRDRLAAAGHPDGLTLTAVHPDTAEDLALARSWAADLGAAGIDVRLVALDDANHRALLTGTGDAPALRWDLATASFSAPWAYGNARVFLQPLVGEGPGNPGGYRDPGVARVVERALDAADPREAVALWQEVERRLLADAAVVPLLFRRATDGAPRGPRVRRATALPALAGLPDLADVRLGVDR